MFAGAFIELRYLRNSQRETFLSRGARAHLPAVLRRTARSHARLSERLSISVTGTRARKAALVRSDRSRGLFLQVEVSDQFMYEKEHLLMGLTFALAKAARADRACTIRI